MTPLVAHILPGIMFGGYETLCLQMIRFSPPNVRHIVISTGSQWADAEPHFRANGVDVLHSQYSYEDRGGSVLALAQLLWQYRPAGVIIYDFGHQSWVTEAGYRAEVKHFVTHVGTQPIPSYYKVLHEMVTGPTFQSVPLIFCSHDVEARYRNFCPYLPPNSQTIWNGIDVEGIAKAADASRNEDVPLSEGLLGDPVFGMVARVVEMKDHPTLIGAFRIAQKAIGGELLIIGSGDRLQAMKELAEGVPGVKFLGNRTDVPTLLGGMDIYVFAATLHEGLGNALVEAMAAGLPIIATDSPGCVEALGGTGLLVPMGDVGAMAEAMEFLWAHPEEAAKLGAAAQARARECFGAEKSAKAYLTALGIEA